MTACLACCLAFRRTCAAILSRSRRPWTVRMRPPSCTFSTSFRASRACRALRAMLPEDLELRRHGVSYSCEDVYVHGIRGSSLVKLSRPITLFVTMKYIVNYRIKETVGIDDRSKNQQQFIIILPYSYSIVGTVK